MNTVQILEELKMYEDLKGDLCCEIPNELYQEMKNKLITLEKNNDIYMKEADEKGSKTVLYEQLLYNIKHDISKALDPDKTSTAKCFEYLYGTVDNIKKVLPENTIQVFNIDEIIKNLQKKGAV